METGKIAAGTSFYIRELEKAKGRIAEFEQRLAAAEARNQTYEEYIEDLGDRSDTCVYHVINKVCSFCQCKRRGDTQW